jgi:glycine betaine catabolism A
MSALPDFRPSTPLVQPMGNQELQTLIASRREGYTLPAPFYRSPELFARDVELIFGRYWFYVGIEPEIAEPGDYLTVEIGGDSVIIVRDDDMQVRAFHNVCRHRGARLRSAGTGVIGQLVCPYHQWTYNLRGELQAAPHMGEKFDRCKFSLKPVHIGSIAGLLFICLGEQPAPGFEDMRATLTPYITPHDIPNSKVAFKKDLIEQGNWKLTMENNRECNHCLANHPELTVPLHEYGFGYQPSAENAHKLKEFDDLMAREHARWTSCGLPSAEVDKLLEPSGYRAVRLPITQSGESQTMDTKVASTKLLGELNQTALGGLSVWTQPNSWQHFMSDHVVSFSVLPISADRTLLRTRWLVHKDAQEGKDYDLERLTSVWMATNEQDGHLVERTQQGVASPAYEPGPYSPFTEGLTDAFTNWYLRRLSESLAGA